ncbi:hypothetical protein MAFF212519_30430 [Clavibacter michiganensis]
MVRPEPGAPMMAALTPTGSSTTARCDGSSSIAGICPPATEAGGWRNPLMVTRPRYRRPPTAADPRIAARHAAAESAPRAGPAPARPPSVNAAGPRIRVP